MCRPTHGVSAMEEGGNAAPMTLSVLLMRFLVLFCFFCRKRSLSAVCRSDLSFFCLLLPTPTEAGYSLYGYGDS